jgi:protein-tyrosine-phosphatase
MINVLVLCTANSARSILGEAIINKLGAGRFQGYSAGSHPRGVPNPLALELLDQRGHPIGALRSKSWDVFAAPGAPLMDIVITVCDAAAGESCPYWPGTPVNAHWGIPDPAGVPGGINAERAAFRQAYDRLHARVSALVALPVEQLTPSELQARIAEIGRLEGATELAQGKGSDH